MPDINIGQLATMSLRNRAEQLVDIISNHNATWNFLTKKGNVVDLDGGRDIVREIEYGENGTVGWYSGSDIFDITPQETFDAAVYDWKQLGGTVTINGLEELRNSGKERSIAIIESKTKNLESSMINSAAKAVFADGTGTSGKEMGGLKLLVQDDSTVSSTVGGIPQSTNAFWQNKFSAAAATDKTTIKGRMNSMDLTIVRGSDAVDLILADSVMFNYYLESLQDNQRFTSDSSMASAGFQALRYKGKAEVVYDDQCPLKRMYMLVTKFIYLCQHKDRKFKVLTERQSINQDAYVAPVVWAGNMVCTNRERQGVIIAS